MSSRRVAVVDVNADAAHAFRSMLEVLSGRTLCGWQLVDSADDAHVVVAGFPHGARDLQDWRRRDKHVVAVVEEPNLRPQTPYVLSHPFRVMQVLTILNEIAEASLPACTARAPAADCWEFAAAMRGREPELRDGWLRARAADGGEVLIGADLRTFACAAPLAERLHDGQVVLTAPQPLQGALVPARYVRRPLQWLLWHNAWHAADGLAPWLPPNGRFRARRWPDFGVIHPTREQMQLVAALAGRACARVDLACAAAVERRDIDRLLNALSACGLLQAEGGDAVATGGARTPGGGFLRNLIGGLRRRLALGN